MSIKKVVLVGPAFPLRGGIANFNESLALEMQRSGYEVEIISFSLQYPGILFPGKTQYANGNPPEGLSIKPMINSVNPLSWKKAAKYIVSQNPDVVFIRFWIPFMGPALGTIAKYLRKRGIKVFGITDNVIPHEKRMGDKKLTGYFIKNCDGFITLSKSVLEDISEFTYNPKKMMLPHPVYNIFGDVVSKQEGFAKLKLNEDRNYILFFGLIRGYKGLDLALEAMKDPRIHEKKITLIIAGEFYDKKENYQAALDQLNSIDKELILLHDFYIPQEDVRYYFAASDCVVQPYKTATQSGITQVAYNFNKPMIVTNVGGLPEIVPDGKVGYVVPREPKAIADAILRFYDENKLEEFSQTAKLEKEKFSWKYFVEQLIDFAEK